MRLFDLHCDTLYECEKRKIDLAINSLNISLDRGLSMCNDWIQAFAVWIPDELRGYAALEHFKHCYEYFVMQIDKHSDIIVQCKSGEDLQLNQGKCKAVLAVEGGAVLAGDIKNLDYLSQCGVKMITLTWNGQNELASGAFAEADSGMTEFGKQAVKRMSELSIVPDVSHLSDCAFWELCDSFDGPFIATHSNLRSICDNPRNLTDRQFSEIIRRSGLVGINLYTQFVNGMGECSFENIAKHIVRAIELGGSDVLCMGTDFDGADMPSCLDGVEKLKDFYSFLIDNGIEEQLADKIFYKNARDFFIKVM